MIGVIGNSVKSLTAITSYYSDEGRSGCGPKRIAPPFRLNIRSTRNHQLGPFIPSYCEFRALRGRPFRGNYRLVFDKNSLTYLAPNNMPEEIKPYPFIALPEPGTLSLACKGTETFGSDKNSARPVSMGIVVNFTTRTVQFGLYRDPEKIKITGLDDARVVFGEEGKEVASSAP